MILMAVTSYSTLVLVPNTQHCNAWSSSHTNNPKWMGRVETPGSFFSLSHFFVCVFGSKAFLCRIPVSNIPTSSMYVYVSKAISMKSSRYLLLCRCHTKEALHQDHTYTYTTHPAASSQQPVIFRCVFCSRQMLFSNFLCNTHSDYSYS